MATVTTISEGDFRRIITKVSLAITDAIHEREDRSSKTNNEEGRDAIAERTAKGIVDTLGIKVIDQTSFRGDG